MILAAAASVLLGGAAALHDATPRPEFSTAFRSEETAWFLDEAGRVFEQTGRGRPQPVAALRFKPGGRSPMGVARWRDEWWVADGRTMLFRYSRDGRLLAELPIPVRVTDILGARDRLWVYSAVPSTSGPRFWFTRDGKAFISVRLSSEGKGILSTLLVLAALHSGELLFAPRVGEPIIRKVDVQGTLDVFPLAYVRSRSRAARTRYDPGADDLSRYSSPVRDLMADAESLLVLRGTEDEMVGSQERMFVRRRIDRYDPAGRHLGTATFPASCRWILRREGAGVTALTDAGEVLWQPFGPAVPSQILK